MPWRTIHDTITAVRTHAGRVSEIRLQGNRASVWIACPPAAIPAAGRYLLAWATEDAEAPLSTPLFAAETSGAGFLAAPPLLRRWEPGTELLLRGPLGHGFDLPPTSRRLALAALGETEGRLLPLMQQALLREAAVALFTNLPLSRLPAAVEVHPLESLPEALVWADYLALDLPVDCLPQLPDLLGLVGDPHQRLACPAQALIWMPMPCGGLGDCGVCNLPVRGKHWKLACQDGPVFDLKDLLP